MMKKKAAMFGSIGITMAAMFFASLLTFPVDVQAGANIVPIEGMNYNANSSMDDNLRSLVGKRVYVTIGSGKTFSGLVKAVGNHLVHLEKLDEKEFFDALIRIEDISAIDTKFRDFEK
jgi:hypothetical protein